MPAVEYDCYDRNGGGNDGISEGSEDSHVYGHHSMDNVDCEGVFSRNGLFLQQNTPIIVSLQQNTTVIVSWRIIYWEYNL